MAKFITCVPTGAFDCQPSFHDSEHQPMKAWRCELTALSQRHNLYFVALNDCILVHQPEFPDQRLSSKPKLILHPPVSSQHLRPGIDYDDPHSITRILVDFLGNDEILLATCDDGDVVGYRVEEIQRALDALESPSDEDDSDIASEMRRFLHMNVGASAWGLAVHGEARMLAISANTHYITVLAFALASAGDELPEADFSEPYSECISSSDFPMPRNRDHVITLKSGHNVPAVSFKNNPEDPKGRWLFSTCITGEIELWDLHNPSPHPARKFEMGWCADPSQAPRSRWSRCSCLNASSHPHGAWGAMFLDPRSAHEVSPYSIKEVSSAGREPPYLEDASRQKHGFTEKAAARARRALSQDDTMSSDHSEMMVLESDSEMGGESDGSNMGDEKMSMGDEEKRAHSQDQIKSHTDVDSTVEQEAIEQDQEHDMDDFTAHPNAPFQNHSSPLISPTLNPQSPVYPSAIDDPAAAMPADQLFLSMPQSLQEHSDYLGFIQGPSNDDVPDPSSYDSMGFDMTYHCRHISKPYCQIESNEVHDETSPAHQPCILITKDDIFLLQSPFSNPSPSNPILSMRHPLHPSLRNGLFSIDAPHDRLCFSTQIPELGIFIVASPIGRVAIFALTKSLTSIPGSDAEQWKFGFELEYILPFEKGDERVIVGEEDGARRLVGVAVSPVQGGRREGRWRLIGYFTDHRVVSWEVGRRGDGGVEALIV
ncbi:hypothetical protein BDU57DRAFT_586709 [Ampelomyces quisqualis]|uniref:WD40-repeat-containing domain protein n=1 Tax=Ampelomyces quisqualis TaxID=50730 RepID=A0A6A5QUM8_AMPQU|nr:hypothetical protein BDU57DRAFT_586709 [Ampelomyces quisqualis]